MKSGEDWVESGGEGMGMGTGTSIPRNKCPFFPQRVPARSLRGGRLLKRLEV